MLAAKDRNELKLNVIHWLSIKQFIMGEKLCYIESQQQPSTCNVFNFAHYFLAFCRWRAYGVPRCQPQLDKSTPTRQTHQTQNVHFTLLKNRKITFSNKQQTKGKGNTLANYHYHDSTYNVNKPSSNNNLSNVYSKSYISHCRIFFHT